LSGGPGDRGDRGRPARPDRWQSAEQGALPVLYAAVADLPGDSFTGPSRFAHMRGAPELINRSAPARDHEVAARLRSVSEQLTGTRFPLA
jgi:hypothetical protein